MKKYSFVAKAPCNFNIGGEVKRLSAGETIVLEEEQARIVQQVGFPARNHLVMVGISEEKEKEASSTEGSKMSEEQENVVYKESVQPQAQQVQAPVEMQYHNVTLPEDKTEFNTDQQPTSIEPSYSTLASSVMPQPETSVNVIPESQVEDYNKQQLEQQQEAPSPEAESTKQEEPPKEEAVPAPTASTSKSSNSRKKSALE